VGVYVCVLRYMWFVVWGVRPETQGIYLGWGLSVGGEEEELGFFASWPNLGRRPGVERRRRLWGFVFYLVIPILLEMAHPLTAGTTLIIPILLLWFRFGGVFNGTLTLGWDVIVLLFPFEAGRGRGRKPKAFDKRQSVWLGESRPAGG
jgi:hypothetical protein